jgi:Ribosome associated membrane protein RAMP4
MYLFFQKQADEKYPVGPWLLALFVFVVCGSGKLTCSAPQIETHSIFSILQLSSRSSRVSEWRK